MFRRFSALLTPIIIGASIAMIPHRADAQEMVVVPGGTFQMGDPFNEGASDELPVHEVYVSPFSIDKYEVTNAFYTQFLNAGGSDAHWDSQQRITRAGSPGSYVYTPTVNFETHPVSAVTWTDAVAFCNWRSQVEGQPHGTYRLPTEAEWEKAAGWDPVLQQHFRFGEHTDGCGVSCLDGHRANYINNGDPFDAQNVATPVGYFNGSTYGSFITQDAKSYYGCYDMSGNVWEWVGDWYSSTYYSVSPGADPTGPSSGTNRVYRSGHWANFIDRCRTSFRGYLNPPELHDTSIGFRCAKGGVRVPASSTWGLAITGLLLLTAGTLVVTRRRVAAI